MNTSLKNATFGQLLASADANFQNNSGYRANVWCEAMRVELVYRNADGKESIVSTSELSKGVAPEDAAMKLLTEKIGKEAAENIYFVVSLR